MTVKEFIKTLNQERFDIKKAQVKVHLATGQELEVVGVDLDKDRNEVVLRVAGAVDVKIRENG